MPDTMLDENLIATLEQSLRKTRDAQNRLLVRLREVESEAERYRQEITALENSAQQTEAAIYSLLATMRSGSQNPNLGKGLGKNLRIEDDFDNLGDIPRIPPSPILGDGSGSRRPDDFANRELGDGSARFTDSYKGVPSISENIEPISNRFADRTIPQACTLLLRESGKALHVNEIYNLLVSGGYEFTGKNPTISIAVSLNRSNRFRKVAPGTFDLVMRAAS